MLHPLSFPRTRAAVGRNGAIVRRRRPNPKNPIIIGHEVEVPNNDSKLLFGPSQRVRQNFVKHCTNSRHLSTRQPIIVKVQNVNSLLGARRNGTERDQQTSARDNLSFFQRTQPTQLRTHRSNHTTRSRSFKTIRITERGSKNLPPR
jgi:hypothetical protein